ncbi:MAG: putative peptidoglycan glycosyltransferase FtsW [Candidatus Electryoneaceae bacterium]|nr:putative peptidoglycan glycosyltransferase FtsW [Candidatus Electryoneaceae bacterium]
MEQVIGGKTGQSRGPKSSGSFGNLRAIWKKGDSSLIITAVFLTVFGVVMVYSASWVIADDRGSDFSIGFRQLRLVFFAVITFILGMFVNIRFYRWIIEPALWFIIIVLGLQLLFGPEINNTHRWIRLGPVLLQTSEFARCMVIIFLARTLVDTPQVVRKLSKDSWYVLMMIVLPIALTALQPDLSSAAMMAVIAGEVLLLGGAKIIYLLGLAGGAVGTIFLMAMSIPYQRKRLMDFIHSWLVGEDSYHLLQSKIGFAEGGWFGVGLGNGKQKLLFLPEPHTDFIFAIVGEEWGLIGATILLSIFLFLFFRTIKACLRQEDRFVFLLTGGLAGSIMLYSLIHMSVTVGVVPLTGLPLPFISAGGTSLVVSLWSIGVLWNISSLDPTTVKKKTPQTKSSVQSLTEF